MTINMDAGINSIMTYVNNSSYSMYGSRNYSDGTNDCSGAVYFGLRHAGGYNYGYVPSTETLHDYLTKCGFELIAENSDFPMQRGDVIIWGRKGYSAGAGGHTGIAVDTERWVECTAWKDSTIIYNHDERWVMAGCPYFYAYRLKKTEAPKPTPKPNKKVGETMLLFKENGAIYLLVGNKYTGIANRKDLALIKQMMTKAGYDTWEHTNKDQIKYIKKIATRV